MSICLEKSRKEESFFNVMIICRFLDPCLEFQMPWTPHPGDPAAFHNFIRIHILIDKQKAATGIFVFKMIRCNENICGEWKL